MFALTISIIIRSAYHLRKRAQELQFNAKISGKWVSVPKPTDLSTNIPEWKQGASYEQGTIVQIKGEPTTGDSDNSYTEYFMSVGCAGNRSQPDDYVSMLLYQIYNEPRKSLVWLQTLAFLVLCLFGAFAIRQTMGSNNMLWLSY